MAPQPSVTLVPPTRLERSRLEFSIHRPSRLLRHDVELVFRPDLEAEFVKQRPDAKTNDAKDEWLHECLLAIPTWQPASQDLSEISDAVNQERRTLLENFTAWADILRRNLRPYWCDASCPMEGCAKYGTATSVIYNELEGLTSLLKYSSIPIGCCGIVLHPEWQRCAYPVTLFTTAPLNVLEAAIAATDKEHVCKLPALKAKGASDAVSAA